MFGQIPVMEREGGFGRIAARILGTQHPGCHISESYRGTLHLSDCSPYFKYQLDCEGGDGTCMPHTTSEPVLIQ